MNCWLIGDEAEEAFPSRFLMTCVSCGSITQLYILTRRTNEIANVARNNAALKAFILFSRPLARP
jgi:hypothetical protein